MSVPNWLTVAFWTSDPESVRDLVLSIGGLVGVLLLAVRTRAVHRQAKAALDTAKASLEQAKIAAQRHESQADADRERRITESFGRAVDQLGSEKLETRLGAIYTLERVAEESAKYRWPIMEALTAFTRERAPWRAEEAGPAAPRRPETDVQAALTVIGRRCDDHERPDAAPVGRIPDMYPSDLRRLDLRGTDLRGADLRGANLKRALFGSSHLEGASLIKAHLNGAIFFDAPLDSATVADTELRAHLEGAILICADLSSAIFWCAHLEGADLGGAIISTERTSRLRT